MTTRIRLSSSLVYPFYEAGSRPAHQSTHD